MKPTLFVLMLLMSAGAFAQISVGRKFLGGTLQFAATESNYYSKYREVGLSPYFGFVVSDKWAVGPIASYTYQRSTNNATPDFNSIYKRQVGTLGIFTRRYMPVSSNIFFFVHGQVSYGRTRQDSYSKSNDTEDNTSTKSNLFRLVFVQGSLISPHLSGRLMAHLGD